MAAPTLPAPLAAHPAAPAPPSAAGDPAFVLSAADFERVRALIHQRAGISLHAGKQAMVHSRLARRLRETGHRSFADYLHALERTGAAQAEVEWQAFVNCLTTNLTAFFREEHHFHALAHELRTRVGHPVRAWCNAASTGEEPYSLAMTAVEAMGPNPPFRLLASDIDTRVLETARRAVYAADARGLDAERLRRHCLRGTGANAGFIRVRPELQRLVSFRPFNLVGGDWRSLGERFDLIFCRNVMIYFDPPTQRRVLERMHGVLAPGGLLFVGHSENFTDACDLFRLRGKTIYERV
jgi:chemotaxis protein methyltransferase CheR